MAVLAAPLLDRERRPLRNLRLSVTDRCNLRCAYCMPEPSYQWLPSSDILRFEELATLVGFFCDLGVDKVRLTGGEPLMRRELHVLVAALAREPRIRDLALTTNAVLLGEMAQPLRAAGLHRITVSLDTLRADRFEKLTRVDAHRAVLEGLAAARSAGFADLKIDTVVMRGFNDDELADLIDFGKAMNAEVRFIEYMDVGGATKWSMNQVLSREQILERLGQRFGTITPVAEPRRAPAETFVLADGTRFGIIGSVTAPFCGSCDRSRLTADGFWYRCLYAARGTDLKTPLRAGASDDELRELIRLNWLNRADRGAEARLAMRDQRAPLAGPRELVEDPHLEMHTRGG